MTSPHRLHRHTSSPPVNPVGCHFTMSDENQIFGNDSSSQNQQNQDESSSDSSVVARYKASPLSLTVFKRENDGGTFYNCNLQRTYTTDDGDSWEYTDSLRPRDLRKAARLLQKAADDFEDVRVETPE
jgi:hypothetical protein